MRRYGERRDLSQAYTYRPGAYAILPRDGQLLMTFQADPHWEVQLPGGGIDPGEAPTPALHREAFEETGWRIGNVRRLTTYRRFVFMPEYDLHAEKICHIFYGRPIRRLGPPAEADHTAMWLPPGEALETLANPADADILSRYINGEYGLPEL